MAGQRGDASELCRAGADADSFAASRNAPSMRSRFTIMNTAPDLTKEAPRSPHTRIRDYAILARTVDKCRALLGGNIGDYHYDCPLDNMLFSFKGINGDDLKQKVESGASDEEIGIWVDKSGIPKTPEEVTAWSDGMDQANPANDPEKREWFLEQLKPLGLDPVNTTLFAWLDADDKATYAK